MRGSMKPTKARSWAVGVVALFSAAALTVPAAGAEAAPVNPPPGSESWKKAAVDSLTARTGIDAGRAEHYLAAQPALVKLGNALVSQLGNRSAGFFLEAPVEQPVVTVLDSAAAEKVRAAGARAKIVRHSTAELRRAKDILGKAAKVPDTAWGIDTARNQVSLSIGSGAKGHPNLRALQATATRLGDRVRVEHVPGKMHPTMKMGEEIRITTAPYEPGNVCSLGFNAHDPNSGSNYVITAGHCVKPGANYYDTSWNQIGSPTQSHFGDYTLGDWAVITAPDAWPSQVTRPGQDDQAITNVGTTWDLTEPGTVGDLTTPGTWVCKSGRTSGVTCGAVVNHKIDFTYPDGTLLHDMLLAELTCEAGDSGGPLYLGPTGLGITSGSATFTLDDVGGKTGCLFQPLKPILDSTGLVLNSS